MTNGIILGVDLDGVCLDYVAAFRQFTAQYLGVEPETLPDPPHYSFYESGWGFRDEAHYREVHGAAVESGLYAQLPLIPGASEALNRLSDADFHIRIITNRFVNHRQNATVVAQTAERLDTANIPYRDFCVVKAKADIAADLYIDDSTHNVNDLRSAFRDVIVFTAPYNLDVPGPRANTWDDVERYIAQRYPDLYSV